jgi:hypothetical protein
MSTVYFISSNRAGTDEHEANTEDPFGCRADVMLSEFIMLRRVFFHFSIEMPRKPTADCII